MSWTERDGVVYLMQGDNGLVKIGWTSRNAYERVGGIWAKNRVRVEVVGQYRAPFAEEARVQRLFAHHRAHGEWFRPSPEIFDYFEPLNREYEAEREAWRRAASAHAAEITNSLFAGVASQGR